VCERLLAANQEIFIAMQLGGQVKVDISAATSGLEREETPTQNVMEALRVLLENNLVLDRKGGMAGEDEYRHGFLCAEISDSELPWNSEEEDW